MKTTFIYALCEPGTRTVRYIGKSNDARRRFRDHLKASIKANTHLGNWLRSLSLLGKKPSLVILREVPIEQWQIAEERYIRLARGCGMKLVNGTDGGDGCENPSLETRKKMGDAHRGEKNNNFGKPLPPEVCQKISASKMGVPLTAAHCAAMSAAQTGRARSPAQCAASAARVGYKHSDITRSKMSAAQSGENNGFFGEKHSLETKSLLKIAKTGRKNTPEQNAAISAGLKGHPTSISTRALQSAAKLGKSNSSSHCESMSKARKGVPWTPAQRAAYNRGKARDQEIEWALAPYTLE